MVQIIVDLHAVAIIFTNLPTAMAPVTNTRATESVSWL
jgi:hypothetical protein